MTRLQTPRLILRSYSEADREAFVALVTDSKIMWRLDGPSKSPSALFERMLRGGPGAKDIAWAIRRRGDDAFVGHIFLTGLGRDQPPEIGFVLRAEYWGQGHATEAAQAVLDHGLNVLNFPVIEATVDSDHEALKRVLNKIGMHFAREERDHAGPYLVYATQGGAARG